MPSLDDERITDIRRAAATGSADAMNELLAEVHPLVRARCGRLLPCSQDAEEAVQDTLLSIARHLGTFDESRGSFQAWVSVIATNSARSTYRSLKRRANEKATEFLPEDYDPRTTSVIAGSRLDLLDALEQLERDHPKLVQPFVMRDLGSLPYNQIAEELDVPLGTVKAMIHRARAYVRGKVVENLDPGPGAINPG